MGKESYLAFYPSRPFWAVSKIDFQASMGDAWFTSLMSEVVYSTASEEFSLKICRDGQILLQVKRLKREDVVNTSMSIEDMVSCWGEYLDYLNTFYLLLDSAVIEIDNFAYFNLHEITTHDAFGITLEDEKELSQSISTESIASVFQMARYLSSYRNDIPLECDSRLSLRQVISTNAISHAGNQFTHVISKSGSQKLLASFAKSLAEYKIGNYETSIVLAWFITEAIINELWSKHLENLNKDLLEGKKRINSKRKDFLTGRDFTVSIITNLLELFDILESDLFEEIDRVRGYRNKIVHANGFSPNAPEASLAITVAQKMIARIWEITFTPNLSYSIRGI
jgi:hypothetical protein